MKSRIISLILLAMTAAVSKASTIQIDPALTLAIEQQKNMLVELYEERKSLQNKILTAEAAVTVAIDRIHEVENNVLDYLSNVQGAISNLYSIKRAATLVATEIPKNMSLVIKAIPSNLKGTAIAALVSDEVTNATTEMTTLYPYIKQLVQSGTYDVQSYDENGNPVTTQKKVNLLNAYERYTIADKIVSSLERINANMIVLRYQIEYMSWSNLWMGLDREGYIKALSGKAIIESVVNDWKRL